MPFYPNMAFWGFVIRDPKVIFLQMHTPDQPYYYSLVNQDWQGLHCPFCQVGVLNKLHI